MIAGNFSLVFALLSAFIAAFLGTVVFVHDRKSITNQLFIVLCFAFGIWAILHYFSIIAEQSELLLAIRASISLAPVQVALFFLFVANFPSERLSISRSVFIVALVAALGMSMLAFTPFVFSGLHNSMRGSVPVPGLLMDAFATVLVGASIAVFWLVRHEENRAQGIVRLQWQAISGGLILAYALIILLLFLQVVLFDNTAFVPYAPLFVLPMLVGATYAVLRHQLFNVKVVATEMFTFVLLAVSLVNVFIAQGGLALILSLFVAVALLVFGTLLIQSVLREVRQREELERLTKELQEANIKLEDLSRFKTQLLSLASHQIRAPLAAIKGFAQLIVDGSYGQIGEKAKEAVGKMKTSADGLIELINTLLDFRKVEEGKMEYTFARTDMKKLVQDTCDALRSLALQKGLDFVVKVPDGEMPVNADGPKLKQVIQNLIDNAIKYTPSGSVTVELYEANGAVMFAVRDTGLGFSPELAPHLFEEFVRDERVKKQILGTGLGLFIARKMVEAHGGKIWAESKGLQKGSAFFVTIKKL